jgi:hypothetical protein
MEDQRTLGFVIALLGAAGAVVAAVADPLGIGEGEVFGWLQILGTIGGAAVALLGLALAMSWVAYPGRRTDTVVTNPGQNTTIVEDRPTTRDPARPADRP